MTEIIVYDIDNIADVLSALAAISQVFLDPAAYEQERHIFRRAPAPGTAEAAGAAAPAPTEAIPPGGATPPWPPGLPTSTPPPAWAGQRSPQPGQPYPPEPEPFEPCPDRGTHERLTDCWLCWSDVLRGAAVETDVLRTSWDSGVARLLKREDDR